MPARRKPIEEAWEGFVKVAFPPKLSASVNASKSAALQMSFYAGAEALFTILMNEMLMNEMAGNEGDPTEANIDTMSAVQADIMEFAEKIRNT